jgi:alkanesulfonate monooxygenase SsuD/methylene tetrahydromethanopterin reductase-like flavin-dependent oxidoreductase (luciferase family)
MSGSASTSSCRAINSPVRPRSLILGAGSGWLKEEFAALGVPFEEHGRRLDEGIAMMRAVWSEDPVTFKSRYIPSVVEGMTMTPMPVSQIPLWFGGTAEPALKRTIRIGDGWHGSALTAKQTAPIVRRLRVARRGRGRISRSP